MEVNGTKVSWSFVSAVLVFTFWLGGLSYTVYANAGDIKSHKEKPSHTTAATDLAVVKTTVNDNKEDIAEIKKELKKLAEQSEKNQQEILKELRDR